MGTRRARGGGYFVEEERRATPFARFDEEERERELFCARRERFGFYCNLKL